MPVFGPISEILNAILPGSGYSIARKATASFTIKDGIIHTDDFEAAGKLFSMLGHGDIHFLDDKLDFELRMSAHGPGVLLAPDVQTFRIHRRRQPEETGVASQEILECGIANEE